MGLYVRRGSSLEHDPRQHLAEHPDTPERVVAIEHELATLDWLGFEVLEAPIVSDAVLERVHSPTHVDAIRKLAAAGGGPIDEDTFVGEASFRAAQYAAGGACQMVERLLSGPQRVAFSGVRPAGHHAERDRAMGFCLFNNVAIAAESAIAEHGLERVFVLDWDVHHGNGTAEIFRRRADVLFASIHQIGIYPGTGLLTEQAPGWARATRSTSRSTRDRRAGSGSRSWSGSSCRRRSTFDRSWCSSPRGLTRTVWTRWWLPARDGRLRANGLPRPRPRRDPRSTGRRGTRRRLRSGRPSPLRDRDACGAERSRRRRVDRTRSDPDQACRRPVRALLAPLGLQHLVDLPRDLVVLTSLVDEHQHRRLRQGPCLRARGDDRAWARARLLVTRGSASVTTPSP